jgi:N-hydroxyarylamine O-acetyltransferase
MDIENYLERIGAEAAVVNPQGLARLQRQHLLTVPFENLDIHWNRPIVLDTEEFYRKIVVRRRGGFCYELNGLFNELLSELGFQTRLISARVFGGENGFGPEFDHAAIIVTIGEDEYLADVGFGDFAAGPLRFAADEEQQDHTGVFVVRAFEDRYFEIAKRDGSSWKSQYIFKDVARELSEFKEMCDFQQYSDGRKTLTDSKFIVTGGGERSEIPVPSIEDFNQLLEQEFTIKQKAEDVRN